MTVCCLPLCRVLLPAAVCPSGWHAKKCLAVELQERFMPSFVGARFSISATVDADEQA